MIGLLTRASTTGKAASSPSATAPSASLWVEPQPYVAELIPRTAAGTSSRSPTSDGTAYRRSERAREEVEDQVLAASTPGERETLRRLLAKALDV